VKGVRRTALSALGCAGFRTKNKRRPWFSPPRGGVLKSRTRINRECGYPHIAAPKVQSISGFTKRSLKPEKPLLTRT
jgi:hypothetical protein